MKTLLTTILIFTTIHSLGQVNFRLDTSKNVIDSLYNDLCILSNMVKKHGVHIPSSKENFKWLIKSYGNDSTAIFFHTEGGKLLFRKVNRFDNQKCRWWDATELYNSSGKLIYYEAWKWSCLKDSEKKDPEVKNIDALLYEKNRFTYDSLGRLTERVWWYAPIGGVRKYIYAYDSNNTQTYLLTKLEEGLFWE